MKKLLLLTAIAAASLLPSAAKADVVLLVDLSVANQVTVIATPGLSAVTRTGSTATGFYLQNFFNSLTTGAVTSAGVGNISTFLQAPDLSPLAFRNTSTAPGFNIFSYSAVGTTGVTAGIQAFQGSATFTLSPAAYGLALTALGASVDRNVFFPADRLSNMSAGAIVGTWQVVPEPSTVAFCLVGAGGLLVARLRRKK
jgi:hypothetical protein